LERDAHYYAILALCRACGFNKDSAHLIAFASQFVDDAKINLMFLNNPDSMIQHDIVDNRPALFNMATCQSYYKINTFNYEDMVNNTCAFHFVPGCEGENFTKKLRCKEESPVILDILKDVLLDADLIKLGMVLHPYADSFTHQGFSGMLSKVNDIKNCEAKTKVYLGFLDRIPNIIKQLTQANYEKFFHDIVPAYGHAQAMTFPDIPYLVWAYEYDYSDEFNGSYKILKINNKARFKRAFNSMRKFLENYLTNHYQYFDSDLRFDNFDLLLDTVISEGTTKTREAKWKSFLIEHELYAKIELNLIVYEPDQWLREAFSNFDPKAFVNWEVESVQLRDNFINSNWYHFYLASKWYKKKFFQYCSNYQLNIPN